MTEAEADATLAVLLLGELPVPHAFASGDAVGLLVARARYHGVLQLIFPHLMKASLPDNMAEEIQQERVAQIFWEERHQKLLKAIVEALTGTGIEPIILKGTALAYSHYREPWLRSRGDTDILVPEGDYAAAAAILEGEGLFRSEAVTGDFISYQESFYSIDDITRDHCIDLHRKVNNSELISSLLSFAEFRARAQPLDRLCKGALAPSAIHALQIACIHRGVHESVPYYTDGVAEYGGDRLIWLYDIHLLASSFTTAHWADLVKDAQSKGICEICREGLVKSQDLFATRISDEVMEKLKASDEPITSYLRAGQVRRTWIDMWALPEWRARARYCRELFFPPTSYMQNKYADAGLKWLPWLYFRRGAEGLARRLRRH